MLIRSCVNRCQSSRTARLVAAPIIIVIPFLLLGPWLLNPDLAIVSPTELGSDFWSKQWPNATYILQAWRQWGEIPLWRRAAMIGVPIIGNPSMLVAYPPYWLIFAFPITWAFTLYFGLHLIWAAWGTLLVARREFRLSMSSSVLSSLVFSLAAKGIAHIGGGHIDILAAVAWLPWLWLAAGSLARRPSWPSVLLAAVAVAAQLLTHLPTAWLCAYLVGAWVLSVRWRHRSNHTWRNLVLFVATGLVVVALAIGLSAVQILPMFELLPFSTRDAMTLSESSRYGLPLPVAIGLFFPMALAFPEWVAYVGIGALTLAPLSWQARNRLHGWRFLVFVVALGLIVSLGQATPLYGLLFHVLPGMSWTRVPTRWLFAVQFALSLLAGMGWQTLSEVELLQKRPLLRWWLVLLVIQIAAVAWAHQFAGVLDVPITTPLLLAIGIALVALPLEKSVKHTSLWLALVLAVSVEILALRPLYLAAEDLHALDRSRSLSFPSEEGPVRIFSPQQPISLAQAVLQGIETVSGHDPFQLDHYAHWADAVTQCRVDAYSISVPTCVGNEVDPQAHDRIRLDPEMLGIGHVQYVISSGAASEHLLPVGRFGPDLIYENRAALPLAFTVPQVVIGETDDKALALLSSLDPEQAIVLSRPVPEVGASTTALRAAEIVSSSPNRLELHAEGPGWLFVSQVWSPGWQGYVDSIKTPVYRANVAFCALPLDDGKHNVTLLYRPAGYQWGRWISVLALAGVIAITLARIWLRRKHGTRLFTLG